MDKIKSLTNGWTGRWLDRTGFALVSTFVIATGYIQGVQTIAIDLQNILGASIALTFKEAEMSVVMFCGFISLSGAMMLAKQASALRSEPEYREDGDGVTAIVPVHRDADVLHRSVESLVNANYDDVEVLIVTEPHDGASKERAEAFAAQYDCVEHLENTRYSGSKAGAINYATEVTDGEFVAVFDADERVDPDFLSSSAAKLDDNDVVQGRTVPEPDGFIESLAYYESILLGYVSQQILFLFTDFRMATSRAIVMKRSAFEEVGGYNTDMLTEDYDFSFRCYKHDLNITEDMRHTSRIEAAHDWRDWWGQRKRWMTGYAQTLHNQVATIRPLNRRNLLAPAICAGSVGGNIVMLSMIPKFAVLGWLGLSWGVIVPMALIMVLAVAARAIDVSLDAVDGADWYWPLVPAVMILYSFAGVKAMLEYVFTWDGSWYAVRKGM
jgi:cellulose synthase/poly-beta-1,6-N-acetylglucosamine synthase-like glycosyltransferase